MVHGIPRPDSDEDREKDMGNFTKTDRSLFMLAALLFAALSYVMYDDSLLFPREASNGLARIGQVSFSTNDVRLKTATAFTWVPAQKTDDVHLKDSLFTGDRSEATLQLQDGTVLRIKPNSLITLNANDGQMNLDLRYGDFSSKLGKNALKVTAGDKTFDLEGDGDVKISKPSAGDVEISVLDGSARVKNANGTEQIDKGKTLSLGKKSAKTKAEVKIEPVTADGETLVRFEDQEPVSLEWKTTGDVASYEVDLCSDLECRSSPKIAATREQKAALKAEIKLGPSFWRVRGLDKFGNELARTETRSVVVAAGRPPVITTPGGPDAKVEGAVKINKADDVVAGQLLLTWEPKDYYSQYEMEISADPELRTPLNAASTEEPGLLSPPLPNGIYHYHVRGVLKDGRRSAWSEPSRFQVDMKGELPPRPAKPILAKAKFLFNPVEEKTRAPASVPKPIINWAKAKGAVSYQVQISKTPDFHSPLTYNVASEAMSWPDYKAGDWHVRVIAINKDGLKSAPSDASVLTVQLPDPVLNHIEKIVVRAKKGHPEPPMKELRAQWTEIPLAQSYLFEISETPTFKAPRTFETTTSSVNVPVKPGTYYLRVQARDADKKALTGYSPVMETAYVFNNPIQPPDLVEPFDQASIFLQTTQEASLWLEWKRVKDADFYQVQVASDPNFKNKIVSAKLRENRFLIQRNIPVGKLYWRVRAITEKDKQISDWTDLRLFNIFSKKNGVFVE